MVDFFVYRSCNLTDLGVRQILQRNTDQVDRGTALLGDSGLPTNTDDGSDNPTLDIGNAEWGNPVAGEGVLVPGTYEYDLIPIDTCTGRTGDPLPLPPLVITALGQMSQLRVEFNKRPEGCDGAQLRRDGVIVGPVFPLEDVVPDNITVITQNEVDGVYSNGGTGGFTRDSGADIIAGDIVEYNGFTVKVESVIAPDVFFVPEIPATLVEPTGFYDAANRTGFYEAFSTMWGIQIPGSPFPALSPQYAPIWPLASNIYWPGPLMSFKLVPPINLPLPFMNDIQAGDVILYGSKTGLVVHVERNPLNIAPNPSFGTVLVLPFGVLPIPPLPAGMFWVIYRAEAPVTFGFYYSCNDPARTAPSVTDFPGVADFDDVGPTLLRGGVPTTPDGVTFIKQGNPSYDPGDMTTDNTRTNAFRVVGNGEAPIPADGPPTALAVNQSMIIDGQIVTVSRVFEIIPPGGTISNPLPGFPGEYEIQFTPELSPDPMTVFPGVDMDRPVSPIGPWATIPSLDSPYLRTPVVPATGTYERLSRATTIENKQDTWQWEENGEYSAPAGTVDGTAARDELDRVMVQNAYPGGLDGLFDALRGPDSNQQSDVYVSSNGDTTLAGDRLIATNDIAPLGDGTLIDLTIIRELLGTMCDDMAVLEKVVTVAETAGMALLRFEAREVQIPAASCPPGQPSTTETRLVCVGVADDVTELGAAEFAHMYWSETGRDLANLGQVLRNLGLTQVEADAAINLSASGRVILSEVLPATSISHVKIIVDIGSPTEVSNIIDDTRIVFINDGYLNSDQVTAILDGRGKAGVLNRVPETDPANTAEEGFAPLQDFALKAHEFGALAFKYKNSFDVCDYDAALASLPDGDLKNHIAAFFAIVENSIALVEKAGTVLADWLPDPDFVAANQTIGGVITASDVDPTLGCLAGPQGSVEGQVQANQGSIREVNDQVAAFAPSFQRRFGLSKLFGQAVAASLCSVQQAYEDAIGSLNFTANGQKAATFGKVAIGCLPSVDELQALNIEWPSVEAEINVQVAFECSLDKLNILMEVTNALIAEANEVMNLSVGFEAGFISRVSEARNRSCSAGTRLDDLVGSLKTLLRPL